MTVNILGTEYSLEKKEYQEDSLFAERKIDGYCDAVGKLIVTCIMKTNPYFKGESEAHCKKVEKNIMRHEIIHAFLAESGLQMSSLAPSAWAENEEMVDWFALQFPKMVKVFREVGCL